MADVYIAVTVPEPPRGPADGSRPVSNAEVFLARPERETYELTQACVPGKPVLADGEVRTVRDTAPIAGTEAHVYVGDSQPRTPVNAGDAISVHLLPSHGATLNNGDHTICATIGVPVGTPVTNEPAPLFEAGGARYPAEVAPGTMWRAAPAISQPAEVNVASCPTPAVVETVTNERVTARQHGPTLVVDRDVIMAPAPIGTLPASLTVDGVPVLVAVGQPVSNERPILGEPAGEPVHAGEREVSFAPGRVLKRNVT